MKKTIATIATGALLGLGLTGLGATAAQADCPYTGCVKTTSNASVPKQIPAGSNAKLKLKVATIGNVKPTGKAIFVLKRKGGGVFKVEKYYNGGVLKVFTGKLKRGSYSVKVKFVPNPNTIFGPSVDRSNLKVG